MSYKSLSKAILFQKTLQTLNFIHQDKKKSRLASIHVTCVI